MKKILLLDCVMLGMANGAFADDAFSVANISLPQNAEVNVAVNFSLDEGSTCDAVRGIGYGGVDKGGTVEPSAKKRFDEFCDELDNTDNWLH